MVARRAVLQAGLILPFAAACGRDAPDIIMLPDVGRIQQLAGTTLRSLHESLWATERVPLYRDSWWDLLWHRNSDDGRASLFGLPFQSANMSLIWYDREAFAADDTPQQWYLDDWPQKIVEFARDGRRLFALGAADGWVLAYHFANVLQAVAPQDYLPLAESPKGASSSQSLWARPE